MDVCQKEVRNLMRIACNKRCADCGEHCAVNVDITHCTFLCNQCAGIHREFGDRIKSVSIAQFTKDEVAKLKATTNDQFNEVWMAKGRARIDGQADDQKRRAFLVRKYQNREWYAERAPSAVKLPPAAPPAKAKSAALPPPPGKAAQPPPNTGDLIDFQASQPDKTGDLLDFLNEPIFGQPAPPVKHTDSGHMDDLRRLIQGMPVAPTGAAPPAAFTPSLRELMALH
jgi:hypothetical protein